MIKKNFLLKPCLAAGCASFILQSAQAVTILEFDSNSATSTTSGVGTLEVISADAAFVTSPLSFIGNDGTTTQGLGSATTVTGTQAASNAGGTVTSGTGEDVLFSINPGGGLSGTTAASFASGNFIFFTFTAAQDLDLTDISFISDPNNSGVNAINNNTANAASGALTAGVFVSVNSAAASQFGVDSGNSLPSPLVAGDGTFDTRTNSFNDSVIVSAGDLVTISFAFTDEIGGPNAIQESTRIGSISVEGVAIPEPTSGALLLSSLGMLLIRRRR